MTPVHQVAQLGFGTGTNELYDRVRPSYQSNALAQIQGALRAAAPFNIVEYADIIPNDGDRLTVYRIGSGTGIFTRALLANEKWNQDIKSLKAIEPSEGMRGVFRATVHDERVTVREGTFDNTGVEDAWADLVVVAQAFHWCPDYTKACAEFARILKLHGTLAFIWNLEDRDRAGWVAQLRDRIEQHENDTPQFRLMKWRQVFETTSYQTAFEPHQEHLWSYNIPTTVDITVGRAMSKSYIAVLPADEKENVRNDVNRILEKGDDKIWIDEDAGVFEYPYRTYLVLAARK